jgi:hypothetical protein
MQLRQRDPNKIRSDAIKMAAKKLESGCGSCAQSYLDVARRYGATAEELAGSTRRDPGLSSVSTPSSSITVSPAIDGETSNRSRPESTPSSRIAVPRRPGLRATSAMLAGGAGVLAPRPVAAGQSDVRLKRIMSQDEIEERKHRAPKVDPFGIDSNTPPGVDGMPTNFYIGEMGNGTCACGIDSGCACAFNVNSANAAGKYNTYGYWGLVGPQGRTGYNAYQWGETQGQRAVYAWYHGAYWPYVYGQTIFGDIEAGFGGWGSDLSSNFQLVSGFIDAIHGAGLTPGVYYNFSSNLYPANNCVPWPTVFWGVGCLSGVCTCCQGVGGCSPCNPNCNTLTPVINNWNSNVHHACFGCSTGIVIWQFWIDNCCSSCGCGCSYDFDYTPQNPYGNFTPVGCT